MLDADTKRRIDTARDILVGKLPDPKSQVEQITIALIYKFMDDLDAESEELGGERRFFTGDFAKYGWARLMRSGLGGHETLNLYAEAIQRMPENPNIPTLFRAIFKNAYLPYRDPETLRLFLKTIDEFSYDHSERLGDAFEYLLSVMGSQGDAGQFRTPRHIIDFIVAVIDPKKDEKILDPACGTAGFLISAYKHILAANRDVDGNSTLTPDDRERMARNFIGYDISPDMVRLSLVNLYLHHFPDPQIHEYDTLTSEERWNEYADVILANPPFMSPKGGIIPHTRFTVQSKRSEVLFVDYIHEHLTAQGRAGIIVPEGIIFQSQTAYKQLRKLLVEESLVAVISLPAGVFNPYSGVKTSILLLDKGLAKQADSIAFFKVENDGFGLGAQRREIAKNDLPLVQTEIGVYLSALRSSETMDDLALTTGQIVTKAKIAASGEYNLSGERFRASKQQSTRWPMVPLSEIATRISGGTPSKEHIEFWNGSIPWVSPKDMKRSILFDTQDHISELAVSQGATPLVPKETVLCVVRSGILKHSFPVALTGKDMCFNQDIIALVPCRDQLSAQFLYWSLVGQTSRILSEGIKPGVTVQSFHSRYFEQFQIPLPPLEVQREIVAEIEGYQRVIDGARAVVENYRPTIVVDPEWPVVQLGEICSLGGQITTEVDLSLPYFGADSLESNTGQLLKTDTAANQRVNGPVYAFSGERLLYSKIRPYLNKLTIVDLQAYCSSDMYPLQPDTSRVLVAYLATFMLSEAFNDSIRGFYERASIPKINRTQLFSTRIPLPPLATQQAVVDELHAEQALVNANRELIARFVQKIQATLARVWGEAPASESAAEREDAAQLIA